MLSLETLFATIQQLSRESHIWRILTKSIVVNRYETC